MKEFIVAKEFPLWLAAYWSLFSSGYIVAVTFGTIPAANIRFADTIIGFLLGTVIGAILSYFYGTTMKSGQKDETIEKAVDQLVSK